MFALLYEKRKMFCLCGDKISEQAKQRSQVLKIKGFRCQSCLDIIFENKKVATSRGRPKRTFRVDLEEVFSETARVVEVAKKLKCHRNTIYRRLKTDKKFKAAFYEGSLAQYLKEQRLAELLKGFKQKLNQLNDVQITKIEEILNQLNGDNK